MGLAALELASLCRPENRIVLVAAIDAARLSRGGYEEVWDTRVSQALDQLRRSDLGAAREFLASTHLAPHPLSSLHDAAILTALREAIKTRQLIALRPGTGASKPSANKTAAQQKLVKKIEAKLGRTLHAGHAYKLVADADLGRLPDRNRYEVVARADADAALDDVAQQHATDGELVGLLSEARTMLAADWRPPRQPEGLVLLRRIAFATSAPISDGPALTPSQLMNQVEQVDPLMDGTLAELDFAEVELPLESKEPSDSETADDGEAESKTPVASDDSDEGST